VGLTFTPEVFACGVDIVGPSNLITLLETIPPYWAPMIELFAKRAADHRTEEGRKLLAERSPLAYVDRIRKPLLIGQGANDPLVKPLLCFQYKKLAGFPQGLDGNFRYTYVVIGGRLVRLADLATARPDPQAMVAYVKGCGQHDCDKFANSRGGLIAQEIDAGAAAVTSKDGRRKVILAFAPPKSVLSNAFIPCLHADPYLGDLEPGGSAEASGVILFTEGDLEPALKEAVGLEWLRGAGR
jgi:hypothetical protein